MKMHCVLFILKKGLQSVQKVCIIIFVVEREISQSTKHNGRLAQLGEHLPYKQGVTGSIPVTSIMKIEYIFLKKVTKLLVAFLF